MAAKTKLPVVPVDVSDYNPDGDAERKEFNCQGCDLFPKKRVRGQGASGQVDIMFVGESPSSWSANNNAVFYGRGGRIIRQVWKELRDLDDKTGQTLKMRHMRKWDTYAVQCQVEEGRDQNATASAPTVKRCGNYLHKDILHKKPKIILAFGATALKSLGYKAGNFMDTRGRVVEIEIKGETYRVLPTFSTKHMIAKTGLYNLFYADFVRAVRIAAGLDEVGSNVTLEEVTKDYRIPRTVAEVESICDEIINHVVEGAKTAAQCALAVDTETNTVNPHRTDAKLLCVSFAWDSGRATAIPLHHKETPWTDEEMPIVEAHVRRVLECPKPKVFHNAKFDLKFLELRYKWRVNNVAWDSLLGEHLLREDMGGNYSLKTLGRSYFPQYGNYADKVHELAEQLTPEEEGVASTYAHTKKGKIKKDVVGIEEGLTYELSKKEVEEYIWGKKKDRKKRIFDAGYERVPIDTLLIYAAVDTDLTRRLLRHQYGRMQKEGFAGPARALMSSHCIPGSRRLGQMEFDGFRVDRGYLEQSKIALADVVSKQQDILNKFWGEGREHAFNPNSTQHISEILFMKGIKNPETGLYETRMGPWIERNKKSNQYKTDKKTLKAIAEKLGCPFAKALLAYRGAHKGLTGFLHEIDLLSQYDNYLHTSFHQHGTSTGRLSSTKINMQNLTGYIAGVNIKKIFIPDDPESEVIFNVDWKGAEIRVFTAYAHDEPLITALNDGLDVHSWFTQEIFGIPYEEVEAKKEIDKEMKNTRTTVKRVVFGILYGAMAKKIAETAGISEERAQEVIDKLFDRFPSLKNYMDEVVAQIHQRGFVETLFGRRRRFPLQNVNGFFRGQAERRGKNMKIQSTSSDIVIGQLIEIGEHIGELGGRLCITVHDSIVGTIKKKYLHQAQAFFDHYCVERVAQKYPWLPVKFAHDIGVGDNYGETIGLEDYIKKHAITEPDYDKRFDLEMDEDALNDLRMDDEEEQRAALAEIAAEKAS